MCEYHRPRWYFVNSHSNVWKHVSSFSLRHCLSFSCRADRLENACGFKYSSFLFHNITRLIFVWFSDVIRLWFTGKKRRCQGESSPPFCYFFFLRWFFSMHPKCYLIFDTLLTSTVWPNTQHTRELIRSTVIHLWLHSRHLNHHLKRVQCYSFHSFQLSNLFLSFDLSKRRHTQAVRQRARERKRKLTVWPSEVYLCSRWINWDENEERAVSFFFSFSPLLLTLIGAAADLFSSDTCADFTFRSITNACRVFSLLIHSTRTMFKFKLGRKPSEENDQRRHAQKELFAVQNLCDRGFPSRPSAIAYDSQLRLIVIGTQSGEIRMYVDEQFAFPCRFSEYYHLVTVNPAVKCPTVSIPRRPFVNWSF